MISKDFLMKEMKELKKDILKQIERQMEVMKRDLCKEIRDMKKEINDIKQDMREQQNSVEFISKGYDEMKNENKTIVERMLVMEKNNSDLLSKNKKLEELIMSERNERLEQDERFQVLVNPLELERRACNLELHGLPESPDENCKITVQNIIKRITPDVSEIDNAFRLGGKKDQGTNRPVLIKFKTRDSRNKVYKNKANLKKLSDITTRLFINENLPPNIRSLLGKANQKRKDLHFKFLWTNNGTILLKKAENAPLIVIKKNSDLEKIK